MHEMIGPIALFLFLVGASVGTLLFYTRFPEHLQSTETLSIIRLIANLFTVMTSLLLGLTITSAKGTYETVDRNMHVFATNLILFDRTLVRYGPETASARDILRTYVRGTLTESAPFAPASIADRNSERLIDEIGDKFSALKPADSRHSALWQDGEQQLRQLVQIRWALIEQAEGIVPVPLLILMAAWLTLIFGSFGYLAPRNGVVMTAFIISAFLVSSAIYLILDMDAPYSGPIQVSRAPLARALAEMQHP